MTTMNKLTNYFALQLKSQSVISINKYLLNDTVDTLDLVGSDENKILFLIIAPQLWRIYHTTKTLCITQQIAHNLLLEAFKESDILLTVFLQAYNNVHCFLIHTQKDWDKTFKKASKDSNLYQGVQRRIYQPQLRVICLNMGLMINIFWQNYV